MGVFGKTKFGNKSIPGSRACRGLFSQHRLHFPGVEMLRFGKNSRSACFVDSRATMPAQIFEMLLKQAPSPAADNRFSTQKGYFCFNKEMPISADNIIVT